MKILFAAGGTAGHINPALSIANLLQKHYENTEILFVGTPNGMESKLVPQAGYPMKTMKVSGFQRSLSPDSILKNIKAVHYLIHSGSHSSRIVKEFQPDLAIGTGGYVSGPILHCCAKMGIPTMIHEQNAYPGVTNRILAKEVDKVMLTFEDAKKNLKSSENCVVTGLPVRSGICDTDQKEARKKLGLNDDFTILSFGGSLGSEGINKIIAEVFQWYQKQNLSVNHLHGYGQVGKDSFPKLMAEKGIKTEGTGIQYSEYIHDMQSYMAAADLVICRSGASTLAELEGAGKASILIPYPYATANHQYHNAMVLVNGNAAIVKEQKDLTAEWLIEQIQKFYQDRERVKSMSEHAKKLALWDTNDRILKAVDEVLKKK